MYLVVRAKSGIAPQSLASAVRGAIRGLDPSAPVFDEATMSDLTERSVATRRLAAVLSGGLALVAALLALIGTFAVVSCSVSERQRELGVRVALGATPGGTLALVFREAILTSAAGAAARIAGALLAARALHSQLVGGRPSDAAVTIAILVVLLGVGTLAAAWWPARRATRVEPLAIIRD